MVFVEMNVHICFLAVGTEREPITLVEIVRHGLYKAGLEVETV